MIKKCFSIILVFAVCLQMGSNICIGYAEENKADKAIQVKGKVYQAEKTKEKISLAGIEIQVFSSELDKSVDTADLEIYNSTYEFSVFCDADGNYAFVPPSKDYAIAVSLTSLPEKTGITEIVSLVKQGDRIADIGLYSISHITAEYDKGQMVARAYAADGTEIYALCNENEKNTSFNYLMKDGASLKNAVVSMESIKNMESISKEMQIEMNGVCTEVSYVYDLSEMHLSERIDLLYRLNVLSEEEKMSLYCDATTLISEKSGLTCGTSLIQELEDYYNKNKDVKDDNVCTTMTKIDNVLRSHVGPYLQEGLINVDVGSGNYYYQIHYEAGTGGPNAAVLASAVTTVRDVHNFFINNGFHAPKKPSKEEYYHIYLISGYEYYGAAIPQEYRLKTTAASYIDLRFNTGEQYNSNTNSVTSLFKFTLAHEMYHAISFTYRYNMGAEDKWFDESFASWAGLRYTGDGASIAGYINRYLVNTSISPQDMNGESASYGLCVYALTLDEYNGGIPTIRAILEATEDTANAYTAIQNGIEQVKQSYTLAGEAFNYCSLYICKPTEFYTTATSAWGTASYTIRSAPDTYTVTGDSFTSSRHVYTLNSPTVKKLSISVRRNAGVSGTGLVRNKKDGTTEVVAPTATANDLTIYIINNYGTTYNSVILSVVNGSTNSDNLNCTVSSALN